MRRAGGHASRSGRQGGRGLLEPDRRRGRPSAAAQCRSAAASALRRPARQRLSLWTDMRLQKYLAQAGVASRRRPRSSSSAARCRSTARPWPSSGTRWTPNTTGSRCRAGGSGPTAPALPPAAQAPGLPVHADRDDAGESQRPTDPEPVRPRPGDRLAGGGAARLSRRGGAAADHRRGAGPGDGAGGRQGAHDLPPQISGDGGRRGGRAAAAGMEWNRRPVAPESVVALATTGKNTWVEIVVKETRPRVLKASGEAIGKSVLKISRTKLGPALVRGALAGAIARPVTGGGECPAPRRRLSDERPEPPGCAHPAALCSGWHLMLEIRREFHRARAALGLGQDRPRRPGAAAGSHEGGAAVDRRDGGARCGRPGVPVRDIADFTGAPEMLDGRVKTLHPRVHGGILGRDTEAHREQMRTAGIERIDLVVVNLYPFRETVARGAHLRRGDREHRHRWPRPHPLGGQEPRAGHRAGRSRPTTHAS